jgi:hypothetical protein
MANPQSEVRLFEVNLISDQINALMRRRNFQVLSSLGAALMIAAGAVLAILMVMHLSTALRMRSGTQSRIEAVKDLEKLCADLDSQRENAKKRAEAIAPLLPIAHDRMAWAPKIAAAAAALPPGAGIVNLQATQRDVFLARPTGGAKPVIQDQAGLPQMAVAILCPPAANSEENIGAFVERLKKDETFMNKFDSVHLVAMEQDTWENRPVQVLHVHAQGTPK